MTKPSTNQISINEQNLSKLEKMQAAWCSHYNRKYLCIQYYSALLSIILHVTIYLNALTMGTKISFFLHNGMRI